MIRKKAIFLIVPLLLILLAVWLSVTDNENTAGERVLLTDFDQSELAIIEFENPEESWRLVNNDGWQVENSDKTNDAAVAPILENLMRIDGKLIDETGGGDLYGLENPAATVTFTHKNGDETVLYLGNKTPPGTEYYIADGDGSVYTVYTEAGNALSSRKYQAEDSFILGVEYANLRQIRVDGTLPFTLTKGEESWRFVCGSLEKAIPVDLIRSGVTRHFGGMYSLTTMKGTEENKQSCGFAAVGDTVTLLTQTGETYTICLGGREADRIYIMVDGKDEIYSVIADYFDFIQLYREEV